MKKTLVRLLTLVMTLAMVLGVMPTALAVVEDELITDIVVTDVKVPVAGEYPENNTGAAVADDAPYTVSSISWYNANGNYFYGAFVEGKQYKVQVYLDAKEGYHFDRYASGVTITINGQTASFSYYPSDTSVGIVTSFTATGDGNPITLQPQDARLYYSGFKVADGKARPDSYPQYDDSSRYNYKSNIINVLEDGEPMTAETFTAGKEYTVDIKFTADENCCFDDSLAYIAEWLDMVLYGEKIACDGQSITFRYVTKALVTITEATITVPIPVGGKPLSFDFTIPEDAKYKITECGWRYVDKEGVEKYIDAYSDTIPSALLDTKYDFSFDIVPFDGYAFPQNESDFTVTVNGQKLGRIAHGGERRWGYKLTDISATADFDTLYNVSITNGYIYNYNDNFAGTALGGEPLRIVADSPDTGYIFNKWEIEGNVEINNVYSPDTFIYVRDSDVTINAEFVEDIPYSITAEGCTVSAETAKYGDTVTITFPYERENTVWVDFFFQNEGIKYEVDYLDDVVSVEFVMPGEDVVFNAIFLERASEMVFELEKAPAEGDAVVRPELVSVDGKTDNLEYYAENGVYLDWYISDSEANYIDGVYPEEGDIFEKDKYYSLEIWTWVANEDCTYKLLVGEDEYILEATEDYGEYGMWKTFFVGEKTEPVMMGDLNDDGEIKSDDALLALQGAVSKIELTEEQFAAADVNGDGEVKSDDALLILQYAVKKIGEF